MPQAETQSGHVEETHRAISRLDTEHQRRATAIQRATERLTRVIGRPAFLGCLSVGILLWIIGNLAAFHLFHGAIDPPPFNVLQVAASVLALLFTVLILSTQRREDELADRRERLTLHLAILTEQKTAKAIELLEEMRRDAPALRDRDDDQARAMAQSSGPQTVLDAIETYRSSGGEA